MHFWELFAIAVHQLWSNKVRTLLTTLGILIGVASVVGVVSIGEGLRRTVMGELDRLGGGRLVVVSNPSGWIRQNGRWIQRSWEVKLTNDDIARLQQESTYIQSVLPIIEDNGKVVFEKVETHARFQCTNERYADVMSWKVDEGRTFTEQDLTTRARVCVLGKTLAKDLFGTTTPPVGALVRVEDDYYRVVGVMAEKRVFGDDWGRYILLPYTTYQSRVSNNREINSLMIHARSIQEMPMVLAEIQNILRRYHDHSETFEVMDVGQELEAAENVFFIIKAVFGGIAGISLFVGGIGVMNIMLVSVTERTREIGIRKAIGARPGHILTQFLVEAIALSLFGGLLGILLGIGIGIGGAAIIASMSGEPFVGVISIQAILLALGFSAAVGIFFGVYPALRASRLDPVEALRYE